jgi:hypothetical protein
MREKKGNHGVPQHINQGDFKRITHLHVEWHRGFNDHGKKCQEKQNGFWI